MLQNLLKITLPSLNSKVHFSYANEHFIYFVPNREQARYIECDWNTAMTLSNFDEEDFTLLFLGLLAEHSMVFVSANASLLSATLLLFHSLLKPFKWPHPMVFNLPEKFLHLLDSPFPTLVGLNADREFVLETAQLPETHPNCVFVLLDGGVEILNDE